MALKSKVQKKFKFKNLSFLFIWIFIVLVVTFESQTGFFWRNAITVIFGLGCYPTMHNFFKSINLKALRFK